MQYNYRYELMIGSCYRSEFNCKAAPLGATSCYTSYLTNVAA